MFVNEGIGLVLLDVPHHATEPSLLTARPSLSYKAAPTTFAVPGSGFVIPELPAFHSANVPSERTARESYSLAVIVVTGPSSSGMPFCPEGELDHATTLDTGNSGGGETCMSPPPAATIFIPSCEAATDHQPMLFGATWAVQVAPRSVDENIPRSVPLAAVTNLFPSPVTVNASRSDTLFGRLFETHVDPKSVET